MSLLMRYECTTRTTLVKRFTGRLSESCEGLSQAARFLYVTTVPWLDNISASIRDISHVSKVWFYVCSRSIQLPMAVVKLFEKRQIMSTPMTHLAIYARPVELRRLTDGV